MGQGEKSIPFVVFGFKGYGEFLIIPEVPGEDVACRYHLRPRPHPLPLSVFVTLLNTTASVPAEEPAIIVGPVPHFSK